MVILFGKNMQGYLFFGIALITSLLGYFYFIDTQKKYVAINSFDQCVSAGYPLLESYPEICKMPGKQFLNPLQQIQKENLPREKESNDFRNLTYFIEGTPVTFNDGIGILPSNVSTKRSTTTLEMIVPPHFIDINNDTILDALLVVRTIDSIRKPTGAYYVTASLSLNTGYLGINGLYLGSNLATTSFSYIDNKLVLEYILMKANNKQYKQFVLENAILREQK